MGMEVGAGQGCLYVPTWQLLDLSQTILGPPSCVGRVREDGPGGGGLERLTLTVSLQHSARPKQEVVPKCRIPRNDSK